MARKKSTHSQSQPLIEELDSRTLFSADVQGLLVSDLSENTNTLAITESLSPDAGSATLTTAINDTQELVIIDTDTPDYEMLINDLANNTKNGHIIEFVLLDKNRDGIEQISETLAKYQGLDAVHIISHGSDGSVQLGNSQLDNVSLYNYSETIASWAETFSETGDLLFYGCDLAASDVGQSLINSVAQLTGADVAASDDLTGSTLLGGDWELEYRSGFVETKVAFNLNAQQSWAHLLNVGVDTTSTGTSGGGNFSISHTTSGSNRMMLVGVSMNLNLGSETASSITYNGDSLSLVGTRTDGNARIEIWSLINPDTGIFNVDIVFSSTTNGNTAGVTTFTGIDQTAPLGAFASGSGVSGNGSTTITSAADELVFGVISVDDSTDYDLIPGGSQTEDWDLYGSEVSGGGGTIAGAASVNMTWNWPGSDNWAAGGVSIKPVSTPTSLWFSTINNVSSSGAPDLDSWGEDDILSVSDPDLELGDTTNGTLSVAMSLSEFASDGSVDTDAIHYVSKNVTVGTSTPVNLQAGDLLLSTNHDETLGGLVVSQNDLVGFRPDVAGDYSSGTFFFVLNRSNDSGVDIKDFALIESDITIGGIDLFAGDILLTSLAVTDGDVDVFRATNAGSVTATGSSFKLIDGSDISITAPVRGLEIVQNNNTTIGGVSLTAGTLLASIDTADASLGSNGLSVEGHDVFTLDISQAGTTTSATAAMFLDGSDVGLDTIDELPYPIALFSGNTNPTITSNGGGVTANINVAENTTSVTTVTATDPNVGDTLSYSISGGDDAAKFNISSSNGVLTFISPPEFESPTDIDFDNIYEVTVQVDDGNGGIDNQAINVAVSANKVLWLTTKNDVTASGVAGLNSWTNGTVIEFGDPNLSLDPGTTDGTLSAVFNLDDFASDSNAKITALHVVSQDITIGGTNSLDLKVGDLLLSTKTTETLTSTNSLTAQSEDVFVFRPDTPDDYSAGTFTVLIDGSNVGLSSITGLSLVEQDTDVGGTTLTAGTFLLANATGTSIKHFTATNVGVGTTTGSTSVLIDGSDLGITTADAVLGVELIEESVYVGGTFFQAGQILTSIGGSNDETIGDNNVTVSPKDIFILDVYTSGTNTSADVTIVFDGSDAGFDVDDEKIQRFVLTKFTNNPPTATNSTVATNEDTTYTFTAADFNYSDGDSDPLASVKITTLETVGALQLSGVDVTLNQVIVRADIDTGNLKFNPVGDTNGTSYDSFSFSVNDGIEDSAATYTMTMDVTGVNDAPAGADRTVTTPEDTDYVFSTTDFGFTDTADSPSNNLLGVQITTLPGAGTLYVDTNGNGIVNVSEAIAALDTIAVTDITTNRLKFKPVTNASGTPYTTLTFQVQDNGDTANGGVDLDPSANTITIDVTPINDAPGILVDGTQLLYLNGDGAVAIDPALIVSDDNTNLVSAKVEFGTGYINGEDTLVFTNQLGITGSFNAGTGTLTLTGTATVADYQTALRSVQYEDMNAPPIPGLLRVKFSVNDGTFDSVIDKRTLKLINDQRPRISNDSGAVLEGGSVNIDLAVNDSPSDAPIDLNSIIITNGPAYGNVVVNGDGTVTYTHTDDDSTSDSFTYTIDDTDPSTSNKATVSITITPVNDTPTLTANALNPTYTENDVAAASVFDSAVVSTIESGQSIDELVFTVSNVTQGGFERINLDGSTFVLTNSTNGTTLNNSYGYAVSMSGSTATVTMTTTGATTTNIVNLAGSIAYKNSSEDPTTANRVFTLNSIKDSGGITNGGVDTTVFSVSSTVSVVATNDAPTATNLTQTIGYTEGDLSVALADIVVSDVDNGESITATLTLADPTYGVLTASGTATYTAGTGVWTITDTLANVNTALAAVAFVPATNNDLNTSITTHIEDAAASGPADGSIALNVTAVNDAPLATNLNQTLTYAEDDLSVALFNIVVSDVNTGEIITAMLTLADPAYGSLTVSGTASYAAGTGIWTITDSVANVNVALAAMAFAPVTNNDLNTSITTHIEDASATGPIDGSIALNVTPVNDAPLATNLNQTIAYTEGNLSVAIADIVVSDLDTTETMTAVLTLADPAYGMLTISGTASYTAGTGVWTITDTLANVNTALAAVAFVPATSNDLDTSITTHIEDAAGIGPVDGSIALNVTAINDAPVNTVPVAPSIDEDTTLAFTGADQINISDLDHNNGNLKVQLSVDSGLLTMSNTTGLTFLIGNGTNNAVMQFSGTLADINANLLTLTFTPNTSFNGNVNFTIITNDLGNSGNDPGLSGDASSEEDSDNFIITVTTVNDAPTSDAVSTMGNEDTTSIAITLTGSDIDGTVDFFQLSSLPANGTLYTDASLTSIAATAVDYAATAEALTLYFVPDLNWNGITTFDYAAKDNGGLLDATPATATMTVNAANDAPVNLIPSTQAVNEDQPLIFSTSNTNAITITDIDNNGNSIEVTIRAHDSATIAFSGNGGLIPVLWSTTPGTLNYELTGTIAQVNAELEGMVFSSANNFTGATSLRITTDDLGNTGGASLTDTDTLTIDVTSVNDAPIRTSGAVNNLIVSEDSALTSLGFSGLSYSVGGGADESGQNLLYEVTTIPDPATFGAIYLADGTTQVTTGFYSLSNLQGMRFQPLANVTGGPVLFSFRAQDSGGTANGGVDTLNESLQITIAALNDAPTADAISTSDNEDAAAIAITLTGSDIDGTVDFFQLSSLPANGTLYTDAGLTSNAATGVDYAATAEALTLYFVPDLNWNGITTFDYSAKDNSGLLDTTPATATLTVNAINDAPVAIANTVSTFEDNAYTFSASDFTFSDVESDSLVSATITNLSLAGGTLEHTGGITVTNGMTLSEVELATLVYTPLANTAGTPLATFDFTVNDTDLGVVAAQMAINITAVNDAPDSNTVSASGNEDATAIAITLTGSDIDGTVDFFQLGSLPANGTLYTDAGLTSNAATGVDYASTVETFTLYFVPDLNWNGVTAFNYSAKDNNGLFDAASATATLTVNAINDAPVAIANTVSTIEDNAYTFNTSDFTYSDIEGDSLVSATITNLSLAGGTLEHTGGITVTNGMALTAAQLATLVYTPVSNATGAPLATFDFIIQDSGTGTGTGTATAQMAIEVTESITDTIVATDPTDPIGPTIEPIIPATTSKPVPEIDDTGTGVDLIIDEYIDPTSSHGDISPTKPEPEPDTDTVTDPEPQPEPEIFADTPVEEVIPENIPDEITQAIESIEAISDEILDKVMNNINSENGIGSLTDHTVMWRSIDNMLNDIDKAFAEEEHRNSIIAYGMKGMTFSLSAGFVAWVLRGGSLLATAMSSIPIWRGLDPLPVLAMSAKDRRNERKVQAQELEDEDDIQAEIGKLIDGAKLGKGD